MTKVFYFLKIVLIQIFKYIYHVLLINLQFPCLNWTIYSCKVRYGNSILILFHLDCFHGSSKRLRTIFFSFILHDFYAAVLWIPNDTDISILSNNRWKEFKQHHFYYFHLSLSCKHFRDFYTIIIGDLPSYLFDQFSYKIFLVQRNKFLLCRWNCTSIIYLAWYSKNTDDTVIFKYLFLWSVNVFSLWVFCYLFPVVL